MVNLLFIKVNQAKLHYIKRKSPQIRAQTNEKHLLRALEI